MEIIAKVVEVGNPEVFTTSSGNTIQKVDVLLSQGYNQFIVTAFDKVAIDLQANKPIIGGIYLAEVSFGIGSSTKEGKRFQNVRLGRLAPLF